MKEIVIKTKVEGGDDIKKVSNAYSDLVKQIKVAKGELASLSDKVDSPAYKKAAANLNDLQEKLGDVQDTAKITGNGVERVGASFNLLKEGINTADFGKAKAAFTGLGSAMKAIPIFLLIEGIKLLIENFDEVVKFISAFTEAGKANAQAIREVNFSYETIIESLKQIQFYEKEYLRNSQQTNELLIESLKQKGAKDKEIRDAEVKGKKDALNIIIKAEENYRQQRDYAEAQHIKALKTNDEEAIKNAKTALEEADTAYKASIDKRKDLSNSLTLQEQQNITASIKEQKDANEKYAANQKNILEKLDQLRIESINDVRKKEKENLKEKFDDLEKEFVKTNAKEEQLLELKKRRRDAEISLQEKYADEDLKRQENFNKLLIELFDVQEKIISNQGEVRRKQNDKNRDAFIESIKDEIVVMEMSGAKQKDIIQKKIELLSFQKEKEKDLLDRSIENDVDASQKRIDILTKEHNEIGKKIVENSKKLDKEDDEVKKQELQNEIDLLTAKLNISSQQIDAEKSNQQIILEEKSNVNQKKLNIDRKYYAEVEKLSDSWLRKEGESLEIWAERFKQKTNKLVGQITSIVNQVSSVAMGIWQSIDELEDSRREARLQELEEYYDEQRRLAQEASDKQLYDLENSYNREKALRDYALAEMLDDENLSEEEKENIKYAARAREEAEKIAFENRKIQIQNEALKTQYELDLKLYNEQEKLKEAAFKQDQNMKVVQTIINTISGAFAAFTGMAQAIPGPYGLIAGAVAAAAVAALGAVQVANIKATKYQKGTPPSKPSFTPPVVGTGVPEYKPGGGSGAKTPKDSTLYGTGGVGGNGGPTSTPKTEVVINDGKPVQAYVLASDVSDALAAQEALKKKNTGF